MISGSPTASRQVHELKSSPKRPAGVDHGSGSCSRLIRSLARCDPEPSTDGVAADTTTSPLGRSRTARGGMLRPVVQHSRPTVQSTPVQMSPTSAADPGFRPSCRRRP